MDDQHDGGRRDTWGRTCRLVAICLLGAVAGCGGGAGAGGQTPMATGATAAAIGASATVADDSTRPALATDAGSAAPAVATPPTPAAASAPVAAVVPPAETTPAAASSASPNRRAAALAVWREADPARRVKGSCVGCHGPDFFDLARIGTSRATILRRATTDGATADEAAVLADAVADLRQASAMPATDPQSFRPFQPGGAMLPGATGQQRDIAFGHQLQRLLPTLMGGRIATLAQARQARDEVIDLARGSNTAGANPAGVNVRSLPVGLPFPQWSADAFNATSSDLAQTTLNDWISDLAFEPTDADRPAWLALQQAYLDAPSSANFWRLYAFVNRLTLQPAAHIAGLTAQQRSWVQGYADAKYRSTLIGQQLLRTTLAGRVADFLGPGAIAFDALTDDSHGVVLPKGFVLPQSQLWNVADVGGRGVLQASIATSSRAPIPDALAELGFPAFVQASTRSPTGGTLTRWGVGTELRLAWFWLGFTLDPSMYRVGRSGSTQGGEYVNQTLCDDDIALYLHDEFAQVMRAMARTLPEAGFNQTFAAGVPRQASEFYMGYYLIQYHPAGGLLRTGSTTPEQQRLYTTLTDNAHRMYLLLYADVLARGAGTRIPQTDFDQNTARMRTVFQAYEPQSQADDEALIQRVKSLGGY